MYIYLHFMKEKYTVMISEIDIIINIKKTFYLEKTYFVRFLKYGEK